MKTNKQAKRKLIGITLALLLVIGAHAQVTIGMGKEPNQGSLLDLKENDPDGNNVTAKKGLLLPRVNLTKKYTLEDIDPSNSVRPNEEAHTGLTVYSINKCDLDGDGVYVWMGDQWQKLSSASTVPSVNADKTFFDFPSGRDLRTLSAQTLNMTWGNGMSPNPPTWKIIAGELGNNLSLSQPSGSTGTLTTSPQAINLLPPAMTAGEIAANPYLAKDLKILFEYDMTGCKKTESVHVRQVNKALLIDGKTTIPQRTYNTSANGLELNVASNAEWKLIISPATNTAINGLSPAAGTIQGEEKNDGNSADVKQKYNVASDGYKQRYNFLTFTDAQTPKRFEDITQTIIQCSIEQEMTLAEWKDIWEQFYGLDPNSDEPDSDGDISKNKNRVQWHRDQSNGIFFSAMFGNQRWMINNLAATNYASNTPVKPNLIFSYASTSTAAHCGYPNLSNSNESPTSKTMFNKRERIGMLYNWYAATGNQNTASTPDQSTLDLKIQGICPNGWHLPSQKEYMELKDELIAHYYKYSDNTDGNHYCNTTKDICEGNKEGKSFDPLAGGFNILYAGVSYGEPGLFGTDAFIWMSTNLSANKARLRVSGSHPAWNIEGNAPSGMFSVRCKKD
ncbi:FISUMP domain-containing protein [Prevotella sp. 10(H)]|uniref:FISUMP domain-containing protein n=1 Tax=Prevotella sp. 10(H) TaxID=1158294 RepID=UPI0004A6AD0F|nr:FISUMP domain-containing protein [Prevotella sp. 10(H)]